MTPVTRRQFLAGVGLGGVATLIVAVLRPWGRAGDPGPVAGPFAAPPATRSATQPATSATPSTSATTTTAPPTTTTPPATAATPPTTTTTSSSSTTTTTTTTAAPGATTVEVIGRQAWGAAAPRGRLPAHDIERITVHHTAGFLPDNTLAPRRLRSYQSFHQDSGFVDLAYHLLIDGNGNVYEARDPAIPGETFTDYDPTGHFLPVLDGNFDEQPVPAAQLDALVDVLAWAVAAYGVGVDTIAGHRDYAATACPGAALYPLIADGTLARLVEERVAGGGASLVVLPPEAGAARVAAIESGAA